MASINNQSSVSKMVLVAVVVGVIGIGGYYVLNAPDNRTAGERIGDAVDELPDGLDNAARELESRTPAEKLGDDIKDATD